MLYNNTLTPEDKNKVLSINGLQDQPEVWMGKQCLFRYEENDFLKNDQMKGKMWADVWLAEDTGKEPVCLVYESNNRASLYIWNSGATGGKLAAKAGAGKTPRGHLLLFLLVFRFPTHVFGGSQVQNSSCKYACIRFITFCLWYHKYIYSGVLFDCEKKSDSGFMQKKTELLLYSSAEDCFFTLLWQSPVPFQKQR